LPLGLEVSCQLHPEASTELHSTMQNPHFHHLKMDWQYSLRIPKHGKHNLPSWWRSPKLSGWRCIGVFPLQWSTLWFRLVVIHLWFVPSNNPVKHIFSSAYHRRICKERLIRFIFSRAFSSLGIYRAHTSRNFKWPRIVLYTKRWEHPNEVATLSIVIFLSPPINSSIRHTFASVAMWRGRPGRASQATFERP
jgi:hypothetical protein